MNIPCAAVIGVLLLVSTLELTRSQKRVPLKWGKWGNWSKCSVTCGGGSMIKEKRCIGPTAANISESRCVQTRQRKCGRRPCPISNTEPTPKDTKTIKPETLPMKPVPEVILPSNEYDMDMWGEWSDCEIPCGGGMRYRARQCKKPNGKPDCEEAEGELCNTHPCTGMLPIGEPETMHTTEKGYAEPEPTPETIPMKPAPTSTPEVTDHSNVTEEDFGPWTEWSDCEMPCGGGMRYRSRQCKEPNGKPDCEEAEGEKCNTHQCSDLLPIGEPEIMLSTTKGYAEPEPTAEGSTSTKTMGMKPVPMSTPEKIDHPNEYDMGPWREWSDCEALCGGGMRYRVRECLKPNGKPDCEEVQREICNTEPCAEPEPVGETTVTPEKTDDTMSEPKGGHTMTPDTKMNISEPTPEGNKMPGPWSDWSECSRPCDLGVRTRTRLCPPLSPSLSKVCLGKMVQPCNPFACPPILLPWSSWGDCDKTCGGGTQFRSRVCLNDTGLSDCRFFQIKNCSTNVCPENEEPYLQWTNWTPCSASCGGGKSYRVRECIELSGKDNCEGSDERDCNTQRCSEEMRQSCGEPQLFASRDGYRIATSPGYPEDYPPALDCMRTITSPPKTRVQVDVVEFRTNAKCCDKLTFLEGEPGMLPYSQAKIATLTEEIESRVVYQSTGRHMTIRFQSRSNSTGGRYELRYTAIDTLSVDDMIKRIIRMLSVWMNGDEWSN